MNYLMYQTNLTNHLYSSRGKLTKLLYKHIYANHDKYVIIIDDVVYLSIYEYWWKEREEPYTKIE